MNVPLRLQIGAVVVLFVAAVVVLWTTSTSVIEREQRRASAKSVLDRAGEGLNDAGKRLLASSSQTNSFDYTDPEHWDKLDRRLSAESTKALLRFRGVEGGYFLPGYQHKFLGAAIRDDPPKKKGRARESGPPALEADLIEIQVDAAIRKHQVLFVVEEVAPSTVAIRTAPVDVNGRTVAATWTMIRLNDPLFIDRSARGYTLAAGLALVGIALSLILMGGLFRTIRRQASERDRLQADLRRSERLAALGKLLAGVAHEVRNPLAGIRSTVQLWQRGIGPDAESFADLVAEADRLEGIVARLLHFSRADAQELSLGDLNAVLTEVARLTRGQAEAQRVDLELDLERALPPVLMAAPALMQVFRNLTTNALHAMPDGGTLRLGTRIDVDRGVVEASVADTGPGLGPEVQVHLFEPFFTTKAGGTGLGLAIAREIALAHRGDLRAESRPKQPGARFTLTLPIASDQTNGDRDDV